MPQLICGIYQQIALPSPGTDDEERMPCGIRSSLVEACVCQALAAWSGVAAISPAVPTPIATFSPRGVCSKTNSPF